MFQSLYVYYFIRILKTCMLFQLFFCVAFSMHHIPSFLMKMNGFNFGWQNLFIILGLCLLEFFNFLTMISFILSITTNLLDDFIINDMKKFFIQISFSSFRFFCMLIFICVLYGCLFIVNDLFILPKSNVFLQKKGLALYKNQIFNSIQPRHVVNIPELQLNISIIDRVNNKLIGCLIHSESCNLFLVIQNMYFNKGDRMNLQLTSSKGKLKAGFATLVFEYESGLIDVDLDVVTISNKSALNTLKSWKEIFERVKVLIICILIAFWAFVFVFSKEFIFLIESSVSFFFLIGNVMGFMSLSAITFIFFSCVVILNFMRIKKCLDF